MRHLSALVLSALAIAAAVPAQAAANPIGTGCPGSNGSPTLAANRTPALGADVTLSVTNLPTTPGFVWWLWGTDSDTWAGQQLPVDFAFVGAPGCMLYLSPEYRTFQLQPNPNLDATFRIPTWSSLLGCRLLCQLLVCDSGVNTVGYTSTNGLELLLGQSAP